jgi:polyhydroxyalkanoate synthesis regulator phasin
MDSQDERTLQDRLVDLRNDAIIQAANLYLFGRNVVLAGVGAAALAKDQAGEVLERCVERGELAEADAQQMMDSYRQHVDEQIKAADQARANLTEQARVTLDENLRIISKVLGRNG